MSDELRDTWFYQEILKEGREEERKQELDRWRQTMLSLVQARFASQKMELLAKGQAAIINDPKILQNLIVKVGAAQTAEEAQDYLLSWEEAN